MDGLRIAVFICGILTIGMVSVTLGVPYSLVSCNFKQITFNFGFLGLHALVTDESGNQENEILYTNSDLPSSIAGKLSSLSIPSFALLILSTILFGVVFFVLAFRLVDPNAGLSSMSISATLCIAVGFALIVAMETPGAELTTYFFSMSNETVSPTCALNTGGSMLIAGMVGAFFLTFGLVWMWRREK